MVKWTRFTVGILLTALIFTCFPDVKSMAVNEEVHKYPLIAIHDKTPVDLEIRSVTGEIIETVSPKQVLQRGIPHPWGVIPYAIEFTSLNPDRYDLKDEVIVFLSYKAWVGCCANEDIYQEKTIHERARVVKKEGTLVIGATKTKEELRRLLTLALA